MLEKIEYSDLYKFLASIGLILVGASIIVPWLFLKEDLNIEVSLLEYQNLTPLAKEILDNKNYTLSIFIKILPWLSLSLFSTGFITLVYALLKWKRKQNIVDETEELNLSKLRAELKPLLESEIKLKAETEVQQEFKTGEQDAKTPDEKRPTEQQVEALSISLMNMEKLFFDKITDYNTFDYKHDQNVKIGNQGNQTEIDIILRAHDNTKLSDRIIEIRYIQSHLNIGIVFDGFKKLKQAYLLYKQLTQRSTIGIFIIIWKTKIADEEQINRFITAVNEFKTKTKSSNYRIIILNDVEVLKFDIKNLLV